MSPRRARAASCFGPDWLWEQLQADLVNPPRSLAVALSGGNDSVALLACARDLAQLHRLRLRAIHVHHDLQPAANRFESFCRDLCTSLAVSLTVLRARLKSARGQSIEALARAARYAMFAAELGQGELLLLAQHADDQLETVLLQLLRGTGVAGLSGMAARARCGRGLLRRPLLPLRRAELERWRNARGLEAVDDPMNSDPRFDRSYLRGEVLPKLLARWPGAPVAAARTARNSAEAQSLLTALAAGDLAALRDGSALDVRGLRALAPARRRNALRAEIGRRGLPLPDSARLAVLCGPMLAARSDTAPWIEWPGARAQRELDRLTFEPIARLRRARPPSTEPGAAQRRSQAARPALSWNWQAQQMLVGHALQGILRLERDGNGPLDLDCLPAMLEVRVRQGGERLRPRRGGPRRTVKALLSEARLPRGERASLPLIYAGNQLIAIGDRWLDASVQASDGTLRRGRLSWRSPAA